MQLFKMMQIVLNDMENVHHSGIKKNAMKQSFHLRVEILWASSHRNPMLKLLKQ